jgi:hypothetical protein
MRSIELTAINRKFNFRQISTVHGRDLRTKDLVIRDAGIQVVHQGRGNNGLRVGIIS